MKWYMLQPARWLWFGDFIDQSNFSAMKFPYIMLVLSTEPIYTCRFYYMMCISCKKIYISYDVASVQPSFTAQHVFKERNTQLFGRLRLAHCVNTLLVSWIEQVPPAGYCILKAATPVGVGIPNRWLCLIGCGHCLTEKFMPCSCKIQGEWCQEGHPLLKFPNQCVCWVQYSLNRPIKMRYVRLHHERSIFSLAF